MTLYFHSPLILSPYLREDQSAIGLQITSIEQDCKDLKTDQSRQLKNLRAELLDSLDKHIQSIQGLSPAQLSISQQLREIQSLMTIIPIQHRILRHLLPDEVVPRWDQIIDADPDTCRWVLEPVEGEQDYRQEIRNGFISWLRTYSGVLHISGNPGAGKSTLMKLKSDIRRAKKGWRRAKSC